MARGRYLSLEESQKSGNLAQFVREHPSTGDGDMFDDALRRISQGKPEKDKPAK